MKRSPIQRKAPLTSSSLLRRSSLRAVSRKRARELRDYSALRAEFLADRPRCQFPAYCPNAATVVHHTRGRQGWRLNHVEWWKASCDFHNDFAETRTGEALAIGWLYRIEGAA